MSIRLRLSLIYTGVLLLVFLFFGLAVYSRVNAALLSSIDQTLDETAQLVIDQTKAYVLGDETVLSFPEEDLDVFQSATTFMVATDSRGNIVALSNNLAPFGDLLDPDALSTQNSYSIVSHSNRTIRVLSAPLIIEQNGQKRLIGYLQVGRVMEGYEDTLRSLRWTLLLAGWAAVCLSLFLEDLLSHSSLKPLYDITELASQITRADDLSRRLPDTGRRDEIGQLTRVMNDTLERLEMLFRTQQRLLADVSHELRTPLTTIRGNVDLIRRLQMADPESLEAIEEEAERMTRLVNDLLLLARAEGGSLPLDMRPVDLDFLVLEAFQQVHRLEPPVRLKFDQVDHVSVMGDPDRLKQLVLNLVNNAIQYTPEGGVVTLRLRKVDEEALFSVQDTGQGIPESDLPYIFDRFYRVDRARVRPNGGSGLGLSIAKWIAVAHNGRIDVQSIVGEGTTFLVHIPVIPVAEPAYQQEQRPQRPRLRVLGTGR